MSDIVTEVDFLKAPCDSVASVEEGEAIALELLEVLRSQPHAVGIAANQIGIMKRVCVVHIDRPLTFINPQVVSTSGTIIYKEGCLSFPGEVIKTKRFFTISVKADNYKEIQNFVPHDEKTLLECVCIQHEIDHLNGIVMHDRISKGL